MALERVGPQARPQLAHERCGPQPVAGDVADGEADVAPGQVDDVVPVAAHLVARRQVARRGVDADEVGQAVGQEAALQPDRAAVLAIEGVEQARAVDRGRRLRGRELQQRGVGVGELARGDGAHVQHAERGALDEQRNAEQRADTLHAQDRVQDLGVVDVGDVDRPAARGDAAGEAPSDRDPHAALDLLLEALGGARDQLLGVVVEEQDGNRVDAQDVLGACQQLVEQRLEGQLGQGRVGEPVDVLELAAGLVQAQLAASAQEDMAVAGRRNEGLGVVGGQAPTLDRDGSRRASFPPPAGRR